MAIDPTLANVYAFTVHKLPVGILGASGYAGRELAGIVARHPGLELAFAAAGSRAGERARIAGRELTFVAAEEARLGDAALVFSALPHGASAEWVARARAAGAKVVDLSADLRPGNAGTIAAPYGLPELTRAHGSSGPPLRPCARASLIRRLFQP